MGEIWKPVPGYEGAYEISNMGRLRSLTRTRIVNNCHGGTSPRTDKGHVLAPGNNGNGYAYVSLRDNGVRTNYYVHRLVAKVFLDKPEGENLVVDHRDHNRSNNVVNNLEWVTQKENVGRSRHLMRHQKGRYRPSSTGEKYIIRYKKGYRVNIKWAKTSRDFKNLSDAIRFRNEVINGAK